MVMHVITFVTPSELAGFRSLLYGWLVTLHSSSCEMHCRTGAIVLRVRWRREKGKQ